MATGKRKRGKSQGSAKRGAAKRESGEPGGGAGRRDEIGQSGVYPLSAERPPGEREIRMAGEWGVGNTPVPEELMEGGSELVMRDGVLLGGLTAGPTGAPTINIHEPIRSLDPTHEIGNPAGQHSSEQGGQDRS
jgi:hypothetical protein